MGLSRPFKLTEHQRRAAIKRRDEHGETLAGQPSDKPDHEDGKYGRLIHSDLRCSGGDQLAKQSGRARGEVLMDVARHLPG